MDIEKELLEFKIQAIIEWRMNNRTIPLDINTPEYLRRQIMNTIRSKAAIKYFVKNSDVLYVLPVDMLVKHHKDILTILEYI